VVNSSGNSNSGSTSALGEFIEFEPSNRSRFSRRTHWQLRRILGRPPKP
jgi:hypothetical protein